MQAEHRLHHTISRPSHRALFSLVFAILVSACGSDLSIEEQLALAHDYYDDGDRKSALIEFKNAVVDAPENAEARFQLGRLYLETGNFSSAEKELSRAVSLAPTNAQYSLHAARAMVRLRRWTEVEGFLEGSESWQPDLRASSLAIRGQVQLSLNQLRATGIVLDEAAELSPENPDVLYTQALLLVFQNEPETAKDVLARLIALNAKHAPALSTLGSLEFSSGNYDTALEAFLEARAIEYTNIEIPVNVARVYLALEQYDEALADIDKVLKVTPGAAMPNHLKSLIALRQKDYATALVHSERAISASSNYLPSHFVAAVSAAGLGRWEVARANINQILAKAPNHAPSRKLLAFINVQTGRLDKGVENLSKLDQQSFTAGDTELLLAAGKFALSGGDEVLAKSFFDQASELGDVEGSILRSKTESAIASGDFEAGLDNIAVAAESADNQRLALYAQASRLVGTQKFEEADPVVSQLENDYPDAPDGHLLRGIMSALQEDTERARAAFESVVELDANNLPALTNLAVLARQQNDFELARKNWEKVLTVDANRLKAQLQLSEIEMYLGDEQASLNWLTRAADSHPQSPYPNSRLAEYYLSNGKVKDALAIVQRSMKSAPNDPVMLLFTGDILQRTGDSEAALTQFSNAARLQPDNADIRYRLAVLFENLGRYSDASEAAEAVLARDPSHAGALLIAARSALRNKDLAQATAHLETLREAHAGEFFVRELEAQVSLESGKPARAVELYSELIKENRNSLLINQYATALWLTQKREKATQVLEDWLASYPTDANAQRKVSHYLLVQKQYDRAQPHIEELLKLSPSASDYNNLAWLLQRKGDLDAALVNAREAQKLDPRDPGTKDTLAMIYYDKGDYSTAEDLLNEAINTTPGNLEFKFHLAQVKIERNDTEQAKAILEKLLAQDNRALYFTSKEEINRLLGQL